MSPKVFTFQGVDVIITPVVPKCWQIWKSVKFKVEYDFKEAERQGVSHDALALEIQKFIKEI